MSDYLEMRAKAAKSRLNSSSNAQKIEEERDAETQGTLSTAGTVIGTILGAIAGNPVLGAQLGQAGGSVLGDVITGESNADTLKTGMSLYDVYSKNKAKK